MFNSPVSPIKLPAPASQSIVRMRLKYHTLGNDGLFFFAFFYETHHADVFDHLRNAQADGELGKHEPAKKSSIVGVEKDLVLRRGEVTGNENERVYAIGYRRRQIEFCRKGMCKNPTFIHMTKYEEQLCGGTHMRKEQNPAHPRTATTKMRLATNWLPPHLPPNVFKTSSW